MGLEHSGNELAVSTHTMIMLLFSYGMTLVIALNFSLLTHLHVYPLF